MTAVARRVASSLTLALVLAALPARAGDLTDRLTPAVPGSFAVDLRSLAAPRLLFTRLQQQFGGALTPRDMVSWTEFVVLSEAVTGAPLGVAVTPESIQTRGASGFEVAAAPGVERRDAVADRLLALGYSARETADVLTGRITLQALETATRMVAAGLDRTAASDYLDRQYAVLQARHHPPSPPPTVLAAAVPVFSGPFDLFIEKYADLHQVQASLVRAIISTESAFNPVARSRAGAIGLMQLMPGTATELGVNPFVPEQNIEGGIRYFSQLLKTFGGVELALVAYNAGPGFAQRYARGQAVLYGETRDYVRRVLDRLQASR